MKKEIIKEYKVLEYYCDICKKPVEMIRYCSICQKEVCYYCRDSDQGNKLSYVYGTSHSDFPEVVCKQCAQFDYIDRLGKLQMEYEKELESLVESWKEESLNE